MMRGTQKRMVVVKTAESNYFEEAYFVLRRGCSAAGSDMVNEANRIIEHFESGKREAKKDKKGFLMNIAFFVCGCGAGAILTAILTLVV